MSSTCQSKSKTTLCCKCYPEMEGKKVQLLYYVTFNRLITKIQVASTKDILLPLYSTWNTWSIPYLAFWSSFLWQRWPNERILSTGTGASCCKNTRASASKEFDIACSCSVVGFYGNMRHQSFLNIKQEFYLLLFCWEVDYVTFIMG